MTNYERRETAKEVSSKLSTLLFEKLLAGLRYNYLNDIHDRELSDEQKNELEKLIQRIKDLDNQMTPLTSHLETLQIKYQIEYISEVFEGNILVPIQNSKIFNLTTDIEIDTYKKQPNYNDVDVMALVGEVAEFIRSTEYQIFEIKSIIRKH